MEIFSPHNAPSKLFEDEDMDSSNPTIDVRQGEEIDAEQLDNVLKTVVPGCKASLSLSSFPQERLT